ncbi:MAG: branched-chain amino acid transport system permease protein [Woeseiaceae bacterium]|jgi:branched-chain amino acid transport system permease protein
MQIVFKTSYDQDINILSKRGEYIRVGLVIAMMLAAPLFLDVYYLSELGLLLVYVVAGIGLMVLTGFTGQVSFGHAAFLGIGAYCHSILMTAGVPFSVSLILTAVFTAVIGMMLGRSASRMHGFYLAVATLAFLIIIETIIGEWTDLTGGYAGFPVPEIEIFGFYFGEMWQQYYLDLALALFVIWGAANLLRSPTGRSFLAVRDSELSARSLGVNIEWVKIQSFGISAAITGVAGVLLAHHLSYLSPETFGVLESLKLLLMIVVGGLGSIPGAIFGAIFVSLLPVALSILRDVLPGAISQQAGLEPMLFGLIIVIFVVFEPDGINGRWRKLLHFFETFPYYRKASFVRQKSYLKTERMR